MRSTPPLICFVAQGSIDMPLAGLIHQVIGNNAVGMRTIRGLFNFR
jgi:hypothetical protein